MAATLPAGIANLLAAVGVGGTGILARLVGSASRPLFIGSALLLIAGALTCSRLVTALATSGTALLYLSMFELAGGHTGTMNMTQMLHGQAAARADAPSFYAGLAAVVLSLTVQWSRRRRRACRPILRLQHGG